MRVDHSVEGSGVFGVAVQHVEISVVFLPHNSSESLLCFSREIFKRFLLDSSLVQQLDAFPKAYLYDWVGALKVFERILLVNDAKLARVPRLHILKHEHHQFANQVQDFEVVVLEFHFQIQACELTQVSVRVGVLSSENGADLENTLKIAAQGHLLVQLGALGETRILFEVFQAEHVRTSLRGAPDEFGRVDFDKVAGQQEFAVKLAHAGLETENGLVGWNAQIDNAVVQADVLLDNGHLLAVFGFLGTALAVFRCLVQHLAGCVFKLEGQNWN